MSANDFSINTPNISEKNIINHREYNIKNENNIYNLKIEVGQKDIYFTLTNLNDNLEYIYKNKIDSLTIINKLELNPSKFSNLDLILKLLDNINLKNQISIKINDDNSCNLLIKLTNIFNEEILGEFKLYKEYMNNNDKFNFLFNYIKLIQNEKKNA